MVARKTNKVKRSSKERKSDIVLPWIVTTHRRMECQKCGASVDIKDDGVYADDIPHIRLPNNWFRVHSNPNHSVDPDRQKGLR